MSVRRHSKVKIVAMPKRLIRSKIMKLFTLALICLNPLSALILDTIPSALEKVFGTEVKIERKTLFLTENQLKAAGELTSTPVKQSALLTVYIVRNKSKIIGYAYIDAHVVRTMQETVMIVVDTSAQVKRIMVLSFNEPHEYLPSDRWLAQYSGKPLSPALSLKGDIQMLTGATLSARAIDQSTRRILAIHKVVFQK